MADTREGERSAAGKVRALRWLCEAVVALVLAALIARTWLFQTFVVDSSSMAPALFGPHVRIECASCSKRFAVGVEGAATAGRPAICGNCGFANDPLPLDQTVTGDRVVVDRSAYCFRSPRRWDLVVCRGADGQACVKRVAGLPGESIEIVAGDVYSNGQIVRKSLAEQRAMAVDVHDDHDRAASSHGALDCWDAAADGPWRRQSQGYFCAPTQDGSAWLTYHHERWNGAAGTIDAGPVVDIADYNQTFPVVDVFPVPDLMLSFQVTAEGAGTLFLSATAGAQQVFVAIDGDGRATLRLGDEILTTASMPPLCDSRPHRVDLSLFDRQCLLAVDGREVAAAPLPLEDLGTPGAGSFAMRAEKLALTVEDLQIRRDVYYRPVRGSRGESAAATAWKLADDEYFVLADNSVRGIDSRHPNFGPGISTKSLLGRPLARLRSAASR